LILHPNVPSPADNMKQFIIAHAWTRVPADQIGGQPNLDVVYNLARGDGAHSDDPCAIGFGKRGVEPVSACSRVQSSTSSRGVSTSTLSTRSVCLLQT
jgi:hypothetical protein